MNLSEDDLKQFFKHDHTPQHSNIELLTAGPGHATAKMVLQPHHLNALKTVHGGAIFTLADFTFAVACNSHGTLAVALEASIVFMKAATTGTLWAEAREMSKNFKVGALRSRDKGRRRRFGGAISGPGLSQEGQAAGLTPSPGFHARDFTATLPAIVSAAKPLANFKGKVVQCRRADRIAIQRQRQTQQSLALGDVAIAPRQSSMACIRAVPRSRRRRCGDDASVQRRADGQHRFALQRVADIRAGGV